MGREAIRWRMRAGLIVGALVAGLLVVAATYAAASPERQHLGEQAVSTARTGQIVGAVARPTGAARKRFRPSVMVFQLTPTYEERAPRLRRSGSFSLRVPPGLHAVVANGWKRGRPTTTVTIAKVRAGRTVRAKRQTATPQPPSVRVSVGGITVSAPGAPNNWGRGMDSMTQGGVFTSIPKRCDIAVVGDRKYGSTYKTILKELRFQTTRYFPPKVRAEARQALRNLNRWAPTHRLTGNVDRLSDTAAAGTFRLVNMKTGKTEWQQRVEVTGPNAAFDIADAAGLAAARQLCDPEKLIIQVRGTFVGHDDTAQATVGASFRIEATSVPGEVGNYETKSPAQWAIESESLTRIAGDCSVQLTSTTSQPYPPGSAAALDDTGVTVFLVPMLTSAYRQGPPPDSCIDSDDSLIASAGTAPGLALHLPLGTPTRFAGQNEFGSYDLTVTVAPG